MRFINKWLDRAPGRRDGSYLAPLWLGLALLLGLSAGWAQDRDGLPDHGGNGRSFSDEDLGPAADGKKSPAAGANALVAINFQDVDIPVLARFISDITNKNFIVDEKVRGKVTIVSPHKVTPDEAYAVFQSVLQVKGFTTVAGRGIIKIVPSHDAKQAGLPMPANGSLAAAGDEFVTRLVPLRYASAADMVPVLQPMVSQDGLVIPYAATNTLILTDSAANVRRLLGMLEELDVEGNERVTEVIQLTHAFAGDLAKKIEEIMKEQGGNEGVAGVPRVRPVTAAGGAPLPAGGAGNAVRVLPDERTNSLIVTSSPPDLKTVRRLVARLDAPLPPGTSKIHVYPLKHANAEEMLPVLADLIGARAGAGGGSISAPRRERRPRREERFGRQSDRYGSAMGDRSSPPTAPPTQPQAAPSISGTAPEFSSEVAITADPATNSLLVSAAPQDFETLKKVIDQLDVRRRQVYVEAMILEVSVDRARELGIEWQGSFSINGQGVGLGRVNLKDLNTALTNPASLSGLLLAAASNKTIELPDGTRIPAQVALLRAAQSSSDINVLSSPTLLTTDNQEAEILVGQNVPFVASRATDTTQLRNLFATVERQDVGITLRLTPQISDGNSVRLDIYEEVSAIVPTTVGDPNLVGPTTSVRSASTTVVVKDAQTVVIGGLISDNTTRQRESVPYLQDLPVLGNLFRTDDDRSNKINLLIFLTPHIVRDDTEIAERSLNERDRFRDFLQEHKVPRQWQKQLDRPSLAPPPDRQSGGVLLPAAGGDP
ncbi:MAG TPA: type II secretion system secretin GspD [Candidatus Binatia bacterium]|nr:type II secretion system secretin GspD [Candidatus Binatia bacterium]